MAIGLVVGLVVAVVNAGADIKLHVVHEANPARLPDPNNPIDQNVVAAEGLVQILVHSDIAPTGRTLQRLWILSGFDVGSFEVGIRFGGSAGSGRAAQAI